MAILEFRPRYRFESPLTPEEIAVRIQQRVTELNPQGLWLKNAHYHLTLSFPTNSTEAWSPQMDINFEDQPNGRTLIRCLIGPSPGIWMLFAGGYLMLTLLGLTGVTLGLAQWTVGEDPWGFWALPVALVGVMVMVVLARTGHQRAHDEMRILKLFVDEALGCDCFKLAEAQAL
jgi:hypothetical protein